MITRLFSIFDPSIRIFSFSWFLAFLFLLIFPTSLFLFSYSSYCGFSFLGFLNKEISYVYSFPKKGVVRFLCSVFLLIFVFNFLSLFSFLFCYTSHVVVTFPLSFIFWLSIIIFSFYKSFYGMLSHLIPVGTPLGLLRFIVIVEIISNLIRPISLTFRLTANIMAGHLLISLITSFFVSLSFYFFLLSTLFSSLLFLIEIGVSFIQAYVFFTLLLLYLREGAT